MIGNIGAEDDRASDGHHEKHDKPEVTKCMTTKIASPSPTSITAGPSQVSDKQSDISSPQCNVSCISHINAPSDDSKDTRIRPLQNQSTTCSSVSVTNAVTGSPFRGGNRIASMANSPRRSGMDPMLLSMLLAQLEYYFSPQNLCHDAFLQSVMKQHQGYVPVSIVSNFSNVKKILRTSNGQICYTRVIEAASFSKMLDVVMLRDKEDVHNRTNKLLGIGPRERYDFVHMVHPPAPMSPIAHGAMHMSQMVTNPVLHGYQYPYSPSGSPGMPATPCRTTCIPLTPGSAPRGRPPMVPATPGSESKIAGRHSTDTLRNQPKQNAEHQQDQHQRLINQHGIPSGSQMKPSPEQRNLASNISAAVSNGTVAISPRTQQDVLSPDVMQCHQSPIPPQHLVERNNIVIRDMPDGVTKEDIINLLLSSWPDNEDGSLKTTEITSDKLTNSWFVQLDTSVNRETIASCITNLRAKEFRGESIRARLKTEKCTANGVSIVGSPGPPMVTSPLRSVAIPLYGMPVVPYFLHGYGAAKKAHYHRKPARFQKSPAHGNETGGTIVKGKNNMAERNFDNGSHGAADTGDTGNRITENRQTKQRKPSASPRNKVNSNECNLGQKYIGRGNSEDNANGKSKNQRQRHSVKSEGKRNKGKKSSGTIPPSEAVVPKLPPKIDSVHYPTLGGSLPLAKGQGLTIDYAAALLGQPRSKILGDVEFPLAGSNVGELPASLSCVGKHALSRRDDTKEAVRDHEVTLEENEEERDNNEASESRRMSFCTFKHNDAVALGVESGQNKRMPGDESRTSGSSDVSSGECNLPTLRLPSEKHVSTHEVLSSDTKSTDSSSFSEQGSPSLSLSSVSHKEVEDQFNGDATHVASIQGSSTTQARSQWGTSPKTSFADVVKTN